MKVENAPWSLGCLAGLIVLLLGLIVNAGCAHHASKLDPPGYSFGPVARYNAAVQITARCIGMDGETYVWNGSGVIVSKDRLLTAGHIAETEGMICAFTAEDIKGQTFLIRPIAVLSSNDIDLASMGLISYTEEFNAERTRFGSVPLLGDKVCVATAYPRREYKCGDVMMPKADPPGDIRIDLVVEPGNSGSGLYNANGELVGIMVHTYPNRGNKQYISGGASSLEGHLKELMR